MNIERIQGRFCNKKQDLPFLRSNTEKKEECGWHFLQVQ